MAYKRNPSRAEQIVDLHEHLAPSGMIPPQAVDFEQSLLGAMMIDKGSATVAMSVIGRPDDENSPWYRPAHHIVYDACLALESRSEPIDLLTVTNQLRVDGTLDAVGGPSYLVELTTQVVTTVNVESHARIILQEQMRRRLIEVCELVKLQAYDRGDPHGLCDTLDEHTLAIRARFESKGLRHTKKGWEALWHEIQKPVENGVRGLPIGIPEFDRMSGGFTPGEQVILAAMTSRGKAQPLTSLVLTLSGWKPMGEVAIGDRLASIDGAPSEIVGVFPQGRLKLYRMTFADGRTVECSGDHLWKVQNTSWRCDRVLTTEEIASLATKKRVKGRLSVPLFTGDYGVHRDFFIHPYVLGVLLGDGALTHMQISKPDMEVINRVDTLIRPNGYCLKQTKEAITWQLRRTDGAAQKGHQGSLPNEYGDELKVLGLHRKLSHEKFIPEEYLTVSKEQRLELLRGLLDTDGSVTADSGVVEFSSSSKILAEQVQYLVWSLGGSAKVRARDTHYTYKGERLSGRTSYRVNIRHQRAYTLFTLPRKAERATGRRYRSDGVNIVTIDLVGETEMQCIAVSHPEKLYITDGFIPTHNTMIAMAIARNTLKLGKAVAFISLETTEQKLLMRQLISETGIDRSAINTGRFERRDDWILLKNTIEEQKKLPLYIDDSGARTTFEIRAEVKKLARKVDLGLVIVDYLQLVDQVGRAETREREVTMISRQLRAIWKEFGVVGLCLSQFSRATNDDRAPQLSHLRESGALEQDARQIMFIHYPYRKEQVEIPDIETVQLILAKNDGGPIGSVEVDLDKRLGRFYERGMVPNIPHNLPVLEPRPAIGEPTF